MKRVILGLFMMAICVAATYHEAMEKVLFEEAVDSLPAELTIFKDLFGPSFITAIQTVLNDCSARLNQLDATYEPTMEDIRKEYKDGMNVYQTDADIDPWAAKELQDIELRRLQNFLDGANRAREEQRKQIKRQCRLRKQDLLRNRMFGILSVFKDIYQADPDNLVQVTNHLQGFVSKLEEGLEQCRKVANTLDITDTCDADAIIEAIEFIKAVMLSLPLQVERGFPDLPGDTEGENNVPIDQGSTPDIFVGDVPPILMPGPVIVDQPPEDDDGISGFGPIGAIDGSGDTPIVTTDSMVTTDSTGLSSSTGTTGLSDNDSDATAVTTTENVDVSLVQNASSNPIAVEEPLDTKQTAFEEPLDTKQTASELNVKTKTDNDGDGDDDNKSLLPLYIALLVCISLLVAVMVIMIVIVIVLRRKAMQGNNDSTLSENDKVSLMKEGYVNPTYQFFDKSSSAQ